MSEKSRAKGIAEFKDGLDMQVDVNRERWGAEHDARRIRHLVA